MKIKKKLILSTFAFCFISAVFTIHIIGQLKTIKENNGYIVKATGISQTTLDFNVENYHTQLEVWEYAFEPNAMRLMAFESHNNTLTILLKKLLLVVSQSSENELFPDGQAQINKIEADLKVIRDDWVSIFVAITKLEKGIKNGLKKGNEEYEFLKAEVVKRVNINESIFDQLEFNKEIDIFIAGQKELVLFLTNKQEEIISSSTDTIIIELIVLILVAMLFSIYFAYSVTKPLDTFIRGIDIIGRGNLEHQVKINSNDEFSTLADAFNGMTGNLSKTTTSINNLNKEIKAREKVEKTLYESEEKYRSMMEAMKDSVYICSSELCIEYMNPAMIDRVGRDATGEICHKSIYNENKKCSWCVLDQIEKKEHVEYEGIDPKDNRYYSVSNSPVSHSDGTVSKLTICRDITERKEAENRLHKYSHDLAERVKELNYYHEISTLIEKKDISFDKLLQGIVDLIPPAWQYPEITCSRLIINEQEYKTENLQKTKWCQHSDIFVLGEHLGVLEVFYLEKKLTLDEGPFLKEERNLINAIAERLGRITERKQNERDTQVIMESTVGKIGQNLFDFIVVKLCEWLRCDCAIIGEIISDGTVKARAMVLDGNPVSDYTYNLKGSPCAETTRKCYCIYSENVSNLFPDDPDLIEMDAEGYVGISLKGKNGKAIGILCGISRKKLYLTKQTQNVMKIIGTRISTELERIQIESEKTVLEAHIQQSQKMESIGTLAGGIAHDFNNILFPIVGHTEMLLLDAPEDNPFRESLNQIYTGALRASELVKQILTFSRQESGELKLMKMQPIIKEALKLIRSTIPTTIEIKQDISPACGVIKTDPTKIHQIVMNLATNAYHAMEDTGGELKVSLNEVELGTRDLINPDMAPGQYACLTVADTGAGMDKELTEKIFDPFFTTKEKGKGTGMGLSVVHGIVKAMEGAIQVYSEPGKGTEFHVYLPVVKNSSEKQVIHQMKEPIQGGIERILLVDDEDAIITMEKLMLERLGYQVTSRTSSIEALEAFRDSPDKFNLVITDMAMSNMTGDKLSAELNKIRPDIPILLCTGFSETMSEEKAASLGINGFLLKPIVMKDLAQKIREVLDSNKTENTN